MVLLTLPLSLFLRFGTAALRTCPGTRSGGTAAVLTMPGVVLAVDGGSGRPGVREHGWPRATENQRAKGAAAKQSPNCRLLRAAPAAAKNTGQLLCHNLIAALFTRNVN